MCRMQLILARKLLTFQASDGNGDMCLACFYNQINFELYFCVSSDIVVYVHCLVLPLFIDSHEEELLKSVLNSTS